SGASAVSSIALGSGASAVGCSRFLLPSKTTQASLQPGGLGNSCSRAMERHPLSVRPVLALTLLRRHELVMAWCPPAYPVRHPRLSHSAAAALSRRRSSAAVRAGAAWCGRCERPRIHSPTSLSLTLQQPKIL